MTILIVTYDLDKESSSDDYKKIISIIKGGGSWARLSESCYAVSSEMSPNDLFNKIKFFLGDGDEILIFTASSPYFGQHSEEVIEWLSKKM